MHLKSAITTLFILVSTAGFTTAQESNPDPAGGAQTEETQAKEERKKKRSITLNRVSIIGTE